MFLSNVFTFLIHCHCILFIVLVLCNDNFKQHIIHVKTSLHHNNREWHSFYPFWVLCAVKFHFTHSLTPRMDANVVAADEDNVLRLIWDVDAAQISMQLP